MIARVSVASPIFNNLETTRDSSSKKTCYSICGPWPHWGGQGGGEGSEGSPGETGNGGGEGFGAFGMCTQGKPEPVDKCTVCCR